MDDSMELDMATTAINATKSLFASESINHLDPSSWSPELFVGHEQTFHALPIELDRDTVDGAHNLLNSSFESSSFESRKGNIQALEQEETSRADVDSHHRVSSQRRSNGLRTAASWDENAVAQQLALPGSFKAHRGPASVKKSVPIRRTRSSTVSTPVGSPAPYRYSQHQQRTPRRKLQPQLWPLLQTQSNATASNLFSEDGSSAVVNSPFVALGGRKVSLPFEANQVEASTASCCSRQHVPNTPVRFPPSASTLENPFAATLNKVPPTTLHRPIPATSVKRHRSSIPSVLHVSKSNLNTPCLQSNSPDLAPIYPEYLAPTSCDGRVSSNIHNNVSSTVKLSLPMTVKKGRSSPRLQRIHSSSVLDSPASTGSSSLFRFTSFPASLPRINSNHNNLSGADSHDSSGSCSGTLRKRMALPLDNSNSACVASSVPIQASSSFPLPSSQSQHGVLQSHNFTHPNNSLSSFDDDPMENDADTTPSPLSTPIARTRLAFTSALPRASHPSPEFDDDEPIGSYFLGHSFGNDDLDEDVPSPNRSHRLFEDEEKDDTIASHDLRTVRKGAKQRSKQSTHGEEFKSCQNPSNSEFAQHYQTNEDSKEPAMQPNMSFDDFNTTSTTIIGLTPSRGSVCAPLARNDSCADIDRDVQHRFGTSAETPQEVQLHFHLDHAQCSPIPGIADDDGEIARLDNSSTDRLSRKGRGLPPAFPTFSSILANCSKTVESMLVSGARIPAATAATRVFISHDSNVSATSHGSTGSGSTTRSRRPMPDMSAFDVEPVSAPSSASRDRTDGTISAPADRPEGVESVNEGPSTVVARATSRTRNPPRSPRVLCPPTPIRTPAWAHNDSAGLGIGPAYIRPGGKFQRANSLVVTKVLATCSPQVLDGRTSLENSILEEEGRASGEISRKSVSTTGDVHSDESTILETDSVELDMESHDHMRLREDPEQSCFDDNIISAPEKRRSGTASDYDTSHPMATSLSSKSVSMADSFEVLSMLGSGTFADVFKVRSKVDNRLYAVKRNRRQFRGKRDRARALSEVHSMQRLQSIYATANDHKFGRDKSSYGLYLLFFYQAWQEDGHFFCQTELCCRDTCKDILDSLRSQWTVAKMRYPSLRFLPLPEGVIAGSDVSDRGRLFPEMTLWKICHDASAGLSHIHSHGLTHQDIKPANLFLCHHNRFGAMVKIGDFGLAGSVGSFDGEEGDPKYMAPELLTSGERHPSADAFSLGMTLYELASDLDTDIPVDGPRWHEIRSGNHNPKVSLACRSHELVDLISMLLNPNRENRPSVDTILDIKSVRRAGKQYDAFLGNYLSDIEAFDRQQVDIQKCIQQRRQSNGTIDSVTVRTPLMHSPNYVLWSPSMPCLPKDELLATHVSIPSLPFAAEATHTH
jgi:membrane-associated tyrosine- and threonine-specific cdc2-inhibitory kinase